jgi:hypothetical protein
METTSSDSRPNRSWTRRLILPLLFFVGGVGVTGWVVTQTDLGRSIRGLESPAGIEPIPAAATLVPPLAPAPAAVAPPTLGTEADARIAALELRLARIENSGGGISARSSQSDGLLLAFAARRALELGLPLGSLEQEISAHFGASQPHMVAAISAAARAPVTMAKLQMDLNDLAPKLIDGGDTGLWSRFSNGLAGLVTIRRNDATSADPSALVAQAQTALAASDVDGALQAVSRLSSRALAVEWMASARRFSEAQRALAALEKSAISGATEAQVAPPPVADQPLSLPTDPQDTQSGT